MKVRAIAGVLLLAASQADAAGNAESGRVLFQTHCAVCHSVPPDHRAQNAAGKPDELTLALNTVSGMGFLRARLGARDVDDIAAFIGDATLSRNVLTVGKAGSGEGVVTASNGIIQCGGVCASAESLGAVVFLAQSSRFGSRFVEWSGACAGSAACAVTMAGARTVVARFERNGHPINHTDMWWAGAAENGWGMSVVHRAESGQLFSVVYGYAPDGANAWYVMTGGTWNADFTRFRGSLYRPRGTPVTVYRADQLVVGAPVGEATLVMGDGVTMQLELLLNGERVTKRLERQAF